MVRTCTYRKLQPELENGMQYVVCVEHDHLYSNLYCSCSFFSATEYCKLNGVLCVLEYSSKRFLLRLPPGGGN
jgi:hypothetical protein